MLRDFRDTLLSIVYPQECRVCGGGVTSFDHGVACETCWAETTIFTNDEMLCRKCGAFSIEPSGALGPHCHHCREHHYNKAVAVGVYEKALSASVIALKATPTLRLKVRSLIDAALDRLSSGAHDVIVPIPLSKLRQLERGFNQAAILASTISRSTGITVDGFSLARKIHTPIHRVGMDRRARELSVQSTFWVTRPKLIAGKRILLVDDVLTSGATVSSCAGALKKSGAASVDVFTLARAIMH